MDRDGGSGCVGVALSVDRDGGSGCVGVVLSVDRDSSSGCDGVELEGGMGVVAVDLSAETAAVAVAESI